MSMNKLSILIICIATSIIFNAYAIMNLTENIIDMKHSMCASFVEIKNWITTNTVVPVQEI